MLWKFIVQVDYYTFVSIAQATVKECEEILHKINTHPLAAMVSGAKKLLFGTN